MTKIVSKNSRIAFDVIKSKKIRIKNTINTTNNIKKIMRANDAIIFIELTFSITISFQIKNVNFKKNTSISNIS